tara:strand:+ start:6825 stop:7046 length:222 start_codon:yes stop_codon:yes gene_type:complete
VNKKFSVDTQLTATGLRCEIYKAIHKLEWSLHNAPLGAIEEPKRILDAVEEALILCEASHSAKRRQESKNEDK